ncbi:ATPase [Aeromicrobium phragmitis]|uniref:ATPase n=1 Tax=Aeromicrobium phragmitis TaxID=2478914 RepID=A0A3L8PJM6_9ACTN|nr:ATPase [Aeromicrobium phragmitis]RLV54903.1 ATPase [Aeromicrobium phragmitis]
MTSDIVLDRIEREIVIAASRHRVWELVSTPGWWINDGVVVAHRIEPRGDDAVVHDPVHGAFAVRLVEARPQEYLAFRWYSGPDAERRLQLTASTLVEFFLADAAGGGVVLRVVESGFAALDEPARMRRRMVDDNTEGWGVELRAAQRHLEVSRS